MHNTIDDFRPEICILTEENQKYLQFFETGKNYPEKGLGDYIKSDEAIDDLITGDGVSYIVFQKDKANRLEKAIAFFSLQSSAISYVYRTIDEEEGVYEVMCSIPAIKINMFGVDIEYQDLFYDGVPISALVFRAIIDIISDRSMDFAGIKAVYLNSLESAESFYIRNDMLYAEDYMVPYAGEDKELTVMYKFIRDVQMIHEKED